jgi:hypothetical protein
LGGKAFRGNREATVLKYVTSDRELTMAGFKRMAAVFFQQIWLLVSKTVGFCLRSQSTAIWEKIAA